MDENTKKYLGKVLDNRYYISDVLGMGGMAIVYKAQCNRLNRYVAIKILKDEMLKEKELLKAFQTEAKAVAMLSHPNIVSVYDTSISDNINYIVMELIEGVTLKQYISNIGKLNLKQTIYFVNQISKALEHAHSKGVVHRDIKPQNIMVLKDGTIKVADFGISALENVASVHSQYALGSIKYISPEQIRGMAPDSRSDIYSLGVLMYEMLTGRLPYTAETDDEMAKAHIAGDLVPPHEIDKSIPKRLSGICAKAMESEIDKRYQSVTELLEDLDEFRRQNSRLIYSGEGDIEARISNVNPIIRAGELSKEKYIQKRKRARKVSIMSGAFGVLVFIVLMFVFLWTFLLRDIFSDAERVQIPNFVNLLYDDVINSQEYKKLYKFDIKYVVDPEKVDGLIISQKPEADRSIMISPEGVHIELTVSTGIILSKVPDVVSKQYQEATLELQRAGFVVDLIFEASESKKEDFVIKTSPAAGEELSSGSTVYITVSSGPSKKEVTMPNLVGMMEQKAIERIKSVNLVYVDTTYLYSEFDAGTVIKQSQPAYEQIEEYCKIYLWVSLGPKPDTP